MCLIERKWCRATRYQRNKNDPQKREEIKEKEKLKYQEKKETDLRKLVEDVTPCEHKAALKKWKEHYTVYRAKRNRLKSITNTFMRENNPLSAPVLDTALSRHLSLTTKLAEITSDVKQFTWTYTENGHHQGAPDVVGATCKSWLLLILGVISRIMISLSSNQSKSDAPA